jgi:hypothetical protein
MWERLQRFRALEPAARGLFVRSAVLLPVIAASLRLRGFNATQASLRRLLSSSHGAAPRFSPCASEEAARTARMVRAAAHYGLCRPTCLEKSLALWWLLGRRGIASSLRIGARKANEQFEAHAWIEVDGEALNELDEPHHHYAAFNAEFSVPPEVR